MRSDNIGSQLMKYRWFPALVDVEGTLRWSGLKSCWRREINAGGAMKIIQQSGGITKGKQNVNKACGLRLLSKFPSFKAERNAEDRGSDHRLPQSRKAHGSIQPCRIIGLRWYSRPRLGLMGHHPMFIVQFGGRHHH
jgi:hypothetical protein